MAAAVPTGFDDSIRRFLESELRQAANFLEQAAQVSNSPESVCQRQKARLVYDTLSAFLGHFHLTPDEQQQYRAQLDTLKTPLCELGEVFT
jgi:hypothetical protein